MSLIKADGSKFGIVSRMSRVNYHFNRHKECLKLSILAGDKGYHKAQHMLVMMKNKHKRKALWLAYGDKYAKSNSTRHVVPDQSG